MHRFMLVLFVVALGGSMAAQTLTDDQKTQVQSKLTQLKAWGSAPEMIAGVKAAPPAWATSMTQEKWKALSILSPEVKELAKNNLATWLRAQKDAAVSEIFISRADGTKAAFLAKTSSWSHKGNPKHDLPMAGKTWVGAIETDESTGLKQVQVSFPVLEGGKTVGSVVVGLQLSKLQ